MSIADDDLVHSDVPALKDRYLSRTDHAITERKTQNTETAADDQEVTSIKADLYSSLSRSEVKQVVII
jgi:hypothetical protein